jgi:methionyl-tRNA synthetase
MVRVAATLLHPFAPTGTEMIREYLNVDERLWDWEYIDKPLTFFMGENHSFTFLEPKVDFFTKHPSQLK